MKKYTNIIVLAIIAISITMTLLAKRIDFNDFLLSLGFFDEKITVINTADLHGHITYEDAAGGYYTLDEVSVMMGMPVIKGLVNEIKSKNKNTLFLDSGDMFHGTNEANIENGQGIVEVANLMGYTAMVPGNHDFNFGFDRLEEFSRQLNFPILGANIYKNDKPAFDEYKIVDVGGKRVGLFGLTVQDVLSYTNSKDTKGVSILDPFEAAKKIVPILKEKADVVILISHLGDEVDKELVKEVDGIDLILCGHHHFLYEKADKVNNTYLAEAGGYSTHVGVANMYFKSNKLSKLTWKVMNTRDAEKADNKANAVAQKYHEIALEMGKKVVGSSTVELDGIRSHVRSQETNFANLLVDAMRETSGADIGLMNGGGIRDSLSKGDIKIYDIGKALPFINYLVVIEVKGDKIYKALERGVMKYPYSGANGGFLQVSGITFEFDSSKAAGTRIVKVTKDGKPLDKEKYYKVATNDYLYNGGDNYKEFEDAKLIYKGELLKNVLEKYLEEKGQVSPQVEGRIKVINQRYK